MMDNNMTVINMLNETVENLITETTTFYDKIVNIDEISVENMTDYFGPTRDPLYIVIPITIVYMIIFLTGIVGNISTCIVISKNKSMHTATNYYLFSLAISDFLLLISGVPQEVYFIWSRYPYVFGELFCILRGLAAETSANATVLTITAFTVERYVAICHPFLSHTMSKLSRAIRLIVLVWIISIAFAIPQALQFGVISSIGIEQCVVKRIIIQHSFELSTFLFFFAPMTLITVLYVLIGLKLRSSSMLKCENGGTFRRRSYVSSSRQQNNQGTRRVLKMLVAVVVAFFLCWAPFHAQRLMAIYGKIDTTQTNEFMIHIYSIMTYTSGILYYLSTCINPLLYNIMSNKFREAFKTTLVTCCHISKRGNDKKRCYRVLSRSNRRYGRQESTDCSGNSVRDESLHSTSTQKQSLESFSSTHKQSFKKPYQKTCNGNIDELQSKRHGIFTKSYNENSTQETNFHSSITGSEQNDINTSQTLPKIYTNQDKVNGTTNRYNNEYNVEKIFKHDVNNIISIVPSSNGNTIIQERYNKFGDLEISLQNNENNNDHRLTIKDKFFNIFNKKEVRYDYSPPAIVKNDTIYNLPQTTNDIYKRDELKFSISSDDGIISNSSLKDIDTGELTDELNAYMEELKQREKR